MSGTHVDVRADLIRSKCSAFRPWTTMERGQLSLSVYGPTAVFNRPL